MGAKEILDWTKMQIEICLDDKQAIEKIFPNSIYYAHLGVGIGSEQAGDRPVLIVDSYKTSSACVVIPLTLERLNDGRDYHVDLDSGAGTALVEQIRTISKNRIFAIYRINGNYVNITENDRIKINQQLSKICQLNKIFDRS